MQTFLPYPDFRKSAECLDAQRLGKQRVETLQILHALTGLTEGYRNHTATVMWRGYKDALCLYGIEICLEWRRRSNRDTVLPKIRALHNPGNTDLPPWLGDPKFHDSHKSNLLRKDYWYYMRYGWEVPDNLPYVWPVPEWKPYVS